MKNQIASAENSVKNLDIAAFMAKDKKVINDSHKEGDFASETMKKMEDRLSSVTETLRQTSEEFLDGVRAHKKALMAVGLGERGGFLL